MSLEFRVMPPDEWDCRYIPDKNLLNFCNDLKIFFGSHNYSNLSKFGFIPVIASDSKKYQNHAWKEHISLHRGETYAAAYIHIDAKSYRDGSSFERIEMLYHGILKAVYLLCKSVEFDYKAFESDYKKFWNENKGVYENWVSPFRRGPKKKTEQWNVLAQENCE